MTIFVTGGTGFVGSAVVRALLSRHHKVRALVRRTSDRSNLECLPVETIEGDLCDPASLARAVRGCSAIFHVAADYRFWARDPRGMYRTNVEGTEALLKAALEAGVERFVYTSSVATLGIDPSRKPADERTPVKLGEMVGHYHRSKFMAEQVVRRYADQGVPVIIVHPSMPLGPRDRKPTPTGRAVASAALGKIPAYVDTGINIVHVDDVAEGHVLAYEKGRVGENYILGGENMTLHRLLSLIGEARGRQKRLIRVPHLAVIPVAYVSESWALLTGCEPLATREEIAMARRYMYFSSARAADELGYRPRPAINAVLDSVAWFARGEVNGPVFAG